MKKIKFIAASLIIILLVQSAAFAQDDKKKKEKIYGSGKIVTKDVAVKSFNEIHIQGVFSLILTQDSKEAVKIEADDNLQELFEVSNDGQQLVIKMKENVNFDTDDKLKVYVTFNKLKNMQIRTVGSVSSTENLSFDNIEIDNKGVGSVNLQLTAQSVNIDNKGVGNIKLSGKADNAVIKNTGVGNIRASEFIVQTMDIENTGVGHSDVNAEKELKVKDSFLGKVRNKGAATAKRANTRAVK
jgi:type 1 fimbria pilin